MTDVRMTTSTSAASPATPDAPDGRPSDQGVFSPATASSEIQADGARVQRFGTSSFPNIADYAFLSDCETNCLIAPSGAVEWFCLPRPDSPSVFTALLDRSGGSFRVGPFGVQVPAARRYLPGTLVLETTCHFLHVWDFFHECRTRQAQRITPGDAIATVWVPH